MDPSREQQLRPYREKTKSETEKEQEKEVLPYEFLPTSYSRDKIFFGDNNKVATARDWKCGRVFMNRDLGFDHQLVLKVDSTCSNINVLFTTCNIESMIDKSGHLDHWCPKDGCGSDFIIKGIGVGCGSNVCIWRSSSGFCVKTSDQQETQFVESRGLFKDKKAFVGIYLNHESECGYPESIRILPDDDFIKTDDGLLILVPEKIIRILPLIVPLLKPLLDVVPEKIIRILPLLAPLLVPDPELLPLLVPLLPTLLPTLLKPLLEDIAPEKIIRIRPLVGPPKRVSVESPSFLEASPEPLSLAFKEDEVREAASAIDSLLAGDSLPLATTLCGLKNATVAEVVARVEQLLSTRNQVIATLKQKVDLQSCELSKLKDAVRTVAAATTETNASLDNWITNELVAWEENLLCRRGKIYDNNYIFRSEPFALNSNIAFVIRQIDRKCMESITFGVCLHSPGSINLSSLPANADKLRNTSHSKDWYSGSHIVSDPTEGQLVCVHRTLDGVIVKTAAKEKLLFEVDPYLTVFPFLLFNGCVKAVELRQFKIQKRMGAECVVCLLKTASNRAKPCGHVLYCDDCFQGAVICSDDSKCPLCDARITKFKHFQWN